MATEERIGDAVEAICAGDVARLAALLATDARLATATVDDDGRTLLHVVADWPGHRPRGAEVVAVLVRSGADVAARFAGPQHRETALHWAASSDDVEVLDALVAHGADLEADGGVIAGGTPLDDAVAFAQWRAARRLVEHGASTALWHAAALGLVDRVEAHLGGDRLAAPHPWGVVDGSVPRDLDVALWAARHGGQLDVAELLVSAGGDPGWEAPWESAP